MPLISHFESIERPGFTIEYPTVAEDQVGHWEDKSLPGFVVAKCLKFDIGGLVYITQEETTTASGCSLILCSPEDFADDIAPGFKYELEIINASDEYGRLILQHVMANGQINSLN